MYFLKKNSYNEIRLLHFYMYKKGKYLKLVFVPWNVFVLPHIRFHRLMMAISVKTEVWSPKLYMYKVESLKIHQVSKEKIWSLICAHSHFQWDSKCLTEVPSCTANPPVFYRFNHGENYYCKLMIIIYKRKSWVLYGIRIYFIHTQYTQNVQYDKPSRAI